MPTDIKLDQQDGNWLIAEASVLKTTAADFILDSPGRHRGANPNRRALVHDFQDGLTVNFAGDYPGGVTLTGNVVVTGDLKVAGTALSATIASLQSALASIQLAIGGTGPRLDTLENTVAALVEMVGAAIIPNWRTKTEVEQGDEMGISFPSAEQLGLVIQFEFERLNPNFGHEDVVSITPPPGTLVKRGSTVIVTLNLEG